MCDNNVVKIIKENFDIWKKKIIPKLIMTKKNQTSILFDTVAIYLGFAEELLNIEELKIEVTDRGLTQISERGNLIRCAISWKDIQIFKDILVDRLTN